MNTKNTLIAIVALFATTATFAQVGIGTTTPHATAALDVESTTKGFLPPRMTDAQRDAIASPAEGLTIFNTTENCLQWYKGENVWHSACGNNAYLEYPAGTVFCPAGPTAIVEVTSATNKIWMDRNLGASQVATSSTDAASYGDLYQWGRAADGHQCANSATHTGSVSSSTPGTGGNAWDGKFIINSTSPHNWLNPKDNTLWQGVNGPNNPCPSGFRVPTSAELEAERTTGGANNTLNAFNSVLKISASGFRDRLSAAYTVVGTDAYLRSSTISLEDTLNFLIQSGSSTTNSSGIRSIGMAVRCIKN